MQLVLISGMAANDPEGWSILDKAYWGSNRIRAHAANMPRCYQLPPVRLRLHFSEHLQRKKIIIFLTTVRRKP